MEHAIIILKKMPACLPSRLPARLPARPFLHCYLLNAATAWWEI